MFKQFHYIICSKRIAYIFCCIIIDMVLMSAGKAARNQSSISNNTKNFGSMGGIVSLISAPSSIRAQVQRKVTTKQVIPTDPILGLEYMKLNGLIQKNPASSGGVGRRVLMNFN